MGQRLHPLAVATAERPFGASGAESTMLLGGDAATTADALYHTPSLPCKSRGERQRGGAPDAAVNAGAQPSYLDHEALAQHRADADGAHGAVGERPNGVGLHDDEGAVVARPEPDEGHRCRQGAGRAATGGR